MRWHSTVESSEKREFSVLAAVETVVAMGISLWILHKTGSVVHILLSACIAPFLLLRTEQSTELGLRWSERIIGGSFDNDADQTEFAANQSASLLKDQPKANVIKKFAKKTFDILGLTLAITLFPFCFLLIIAIVPGAIKVSATFYVFSLHPLRTTQQIAKNWYRLVFSTDALHPPEIIPGIETAKSNRLAKLRYTAIITKIDQKIEQEGIEAEPGGKNSGLAFFLLALYGPAILYRYSIKSTALIYLPIIWLVSGPKLTKKGRSEFIEELVVSPIEKIARGWAWVVLIILTVLPISYILLQIRPPTFLQPSFFKDYFLPIESISSWHSTRSMGALLSIGLFCWAANILRKQIRMDKAPKPWQVNSIWCGKMLQKACALWTIGCGLYLLFVAVQKEDLKWENLPAWRWLPMEVETTDDKRTTTSSNENNLH